MRWVSRVGYWVQVAVVGAGYIAVEMAGILHAMGSETHLFYRPLDQKVKTEGSWCNFGEHCENLNAKIFVLH